jgi:hypothetical protein
MAGAILKQKKDTRHRSQKSHEGPSPDIQDRGFMAFFVGTDVLD